MQYGGNLTPNSDLVPQCERLMKDSRLSSHTLLFYHEIIKAIYHCRVILMSATFIIVTINSYCMIRVIIHKVLYDVMETKI